jgi:hypothetical protein
MNLLPGAFRSMAPVMALSILDPKLSHSEAEAQAGVKVGAGAPGLGLPAASCQPPLTVQCSRPVRGSAAPVGRRGLLLLLLLLLLL